jgi:DNA-directed RNA polymerase specialized sigma24 family protein
VSTLPGANATDTAAVPGAPAISSIPGVPSVSAVGRIPAIASAAGDACPPEYCGSDGEAVVQRIRQGEEAGIRDLYEFLADGACARFLRRVAPEFREDRRHEILVIVVEAIRSGKLRDPNRLMGFVWTVTRRSVAAYIRGAIFQRRRFVAEDGIELLMPAGQSAEGVIMERERIERARLAIRCLRPRDREILERFYLREQGSEQICREMSLTSTQFRLYKSRAIARCGDRMRGVSAVNSPDRLAARIA